MSIRLWAVRVDRPLTDREEEAMLAVLPGERRERLLRVRRAERRREPLCAYWILRRALWEQYGWREFPQIVRADGGKPCFPDYPQVQFNLSHTGGAVLAGLSDRPLGVDIERIRPVRPQMMRRMAGAETEEEFFRRWVCWEARKKYSGEGIGAGLPPSSPPEDGVFCHEVETFPGYTAGAASGGGAPPEEIHRLFLDDLVQDLVP